MTIDELNVFDQREVHHNCTVEIWKNSVTGQVSIGWYPEGKFKDQIEEDEEDQHACF